MLLSAGFNLSFMDMIIKDAVKSVLYIKRVPNYLCIFQNSIFPHFSPFFPYYGIIFGFSLQN